MPPRRGVPRSGNLFHRAAVHGRCCTLYFTACGSHTCTLLLHMRGAGMGRDLFQRQVSDAGVCRGCRTPSAGAPPSLTQAELMAQWRALHAASKTRKLLLWPSSRRHAVPARCESDPVVSLTAKCTWHTLHMLYSEADLPLRMLFCSHKGGAVTWHAHRPDRPDAAVLPIL